MRLAVIASFQHLADELVPYVGDVLCHMPRYWDVSAEERSLVAKLVDSPPKRSGSVLMFSAQVATPVAVAGREHLLQVLAELEARSSGKSLLLRDRSNSVVECVAAYCGEYDQVVTRVASATQNPAVVLERQAALSALTFHPDPDVVTYALLAQDAVSLGGLPDWRAIETQYIMCSDGVLAPEKIHSVLCAHSPGATSQLRQRQLEQEISSVRPVSIAEHAATRAGIDGLGL